MFIEMHWGWWFSINYFQQDEKVSWEKEAFCKQTYTCNPGHLSVPPSYVQTEKSWKTLLGWRVYSPEKGIF